MVDGKKNALEGDPKFTRTGAATIQISWPLKTVPGSILIVSGISLPIICILPSISVVVSLALLTHEAPFQIYEFSLSFIGRPYTLNLISCFES